MKILIVDDESLARSTLRSMLQELQSDFLRDVQDVVHTVLTDKIRVAFFALPGGETALIGARRAEHEGQGEQLCHRCLELHHDGHQFTRMYLRLTQALSLTRRQQGMMPAWGKLQPEIVDRIKQCEATQSGTRLRIGTGLLLNSLLRRNGSLSRTHVKYMQGASARWSLVTRPISCRKSSIRVQQAEACAPQFTVW